VARFFWTTLYIGRLMENRFAAEVFLGPIVDISPDVATSDQAHCLNSLIFNTHRSRHPYSIGLYVIEMTGFKNDGNLTSIIRLY